MSRRYLVFSVQGQDILSVPAEPVGLRRIGISFYKAISARRWVFKTALRLAVATHIEGWVGRNLPTPVPRYPGFDFEAWLEQVRRDLGVRHAEPVVSLPGQMRRRRFYATLVRPEGAPVAFAKVSLDGETDRQIEAEAEAIRCLTTRPIRSFRVPQVVVEGTFDSHRYLVTEAVPYRAQPVPARWEPIPRRCRDELVGVFRRRKALRDLSWWHRFRDMAGEVAPLFKELDSQADVEVEVGWAHGDFTRRNICHVGGTEEIWLFDWENSASDAPVMTDEVRFFLSTLRTRAVTKPAAAVKALHGKFIGNGAGESRRDLALALAFLSTCTSTGVVCAQQWKQPL